MMRCCLLEEVVEDDDDDDDITIIGALSILVFLTGSSAKARFEFRPETPLIGICQVYSRRCHRLLE